MTSIEISWKGPFDNDEVNDLHAEAFDHNPFADDWNFLVANHSLGWVTGRSANRLAGFDDRLAGFDDRLVGFDDRLVGFANVIWDGQIHAWLQDVMVAKSHRHQSVGTRLIQVATESSTSAGCEWLHVDFDDDLKPFYFDRAGFTPTNGGLIRLD